ncbi:MAG: glucoamylase family protein [Anaerolineae bacterium]
MKQTRAKIAKRMLWIFVTIFMASVSLNFSHRVSAQADTLLWSAWENKDISTIGDDNTGSSVESADIEGVAALRVTPGGASDETKVSVPFTGSDLVDWALYTHLELQVYLPESNTLNANNFFLGMADVTGGNFTWLAGVFSDTTPQPGWNTVSFPFHPSMREPQADHQYNLYLSFYREEGSKIPLIEPFYLGSATLTGLDNAAMTPGAPSANDTYSEEVNTLLGLDDAALIDAVARQTFDFFWNEANPENGLIKDRSTPDSVASIAAVGFGLAAIPIGVDRGWITYDEGYQRVLTTLQTFTSGGVEGAHGFFFHFINMNTGEREWGSELSSIDTALLVAGALVSGQYFAGTEVQTLADELYANVEWDWMTNRGATVKMGWEPESGFIDASWDHFDESMILYVLAIGSPTHPVSANVWDRWRRPVNIEGGFIYLASEPLFVYQYPLAFLNLRNREDHYANYWNNTALACERNRQFVIDHSDWYTTYTDGVWGLSASDGPDGYNAYGASGINHDGTIAPYASVSCYPFTPDIALEGMRAMLSKYGARVWRNYGFVSAINEDRDWYSRDHIGIDEGDVLLMLANAQDSFVWDLFMANPNIQNGLNAMGFVDSTGDYAVTPAYMQQVRGN